MKEITSRKLSRGGTDTAPSEKNPLTWWDKIVKLINTDDVVNIIRGGKLYGWSFRISNDEGKLVFVQAFDVVLSGPNAKNVFAYQTKLKTSPARTTAFSSLENMAKRLNQMVAERKTEYKNFEGKLVPTPDNIFFIWENESKVRNPASVRNFYNMICEITDGKYQTESTVIVKKEFEELMEEYNACATQKSEGMKKSGGAKKKKQPKEDGDGARAAEPESQGREDQEADIVPAPARKQAEKKKRKRETPDKNNADTASAQSAPSTSAAVAEVTEPAKKSRRKAAPPSCTDDVDSESDVPVKKTQRRDKQKRTVGKDAEKGGGACASAPSDFSVYSEILRKNTEIIERAERAMAALGDNLKNAVEGIRVLVAESIHTMDRHRKVDNALERIIQLINHREHVRIETQTESPTKRARRVMVSDDESDVSGDNGLEAPLILSSKTKRAASEQAKLYNKVFLESETAIMSTIMGKGKGKGKGKAESEESEESEESAFESASESDTGDYDAEMAIAEIIDRETRETEEQGDDSSSDDEEIADVTEGSDMEDSEVESDCSDSESDGKLAAPIFLNGLKKRKLQEQCLDATADTTNPHKRARKGMPEKRTAQKSAPPKPKAQKELKGSSGQPKPAPATKPTTTANDTANAAVAVATPQNEAGELRLPSMTSTPAPATKNDVAKRAPDVPLPKPKAPSKRADKPIKGIQWTAVESPVCPAAPSVTTLTLDDVFANAEDGDIGEDSIDI